MHYFKLRLLDGSTGAELWSAVTLLLMGVIWLTEPPSYGGVLYRVVRFGPASPILFLFVLGGLVHLFSLTRPATQAWIWLVRKPASLTEAVLWSMSLVELAYLRQWLTVGSIGLLCLLLLIAVGRRNYRYIVQ
jgi:hypothetical protein